MYQVSQILITKHNNEPLYGYFAHMGALAKNLNNAALFRVRNHFTAGSKEHLTANEAGVEDEIQAAREKYGFTPRRILSYGHLEKVMRATKNPDFFAGLPMQTAQNQLKKAAGDFKNWLKTLRAYKKNPSAFTGKPQMPGYVRSERATFTISNQEAVLYPAKDGYELKLPLYKERITFPHIAQGAVLKEVKVKPFYDSFLLLLTMEVPDVPARPDMPYLAGIDFGVGNTAAIVTNEGHSLLYKGGAMKAANQWFNKERARLTGIITRGHEHMKAESARLACLSMSRHFFLQDQMHKISRSIIDFCVEHRIGTLVLGRNKLWKQEADMGTSSNQAFTAMPIYRLQQMLEYKAANAGISVVYQEESYTSKADFLSGDDIPVYGEETETPSFSGRRVRRGLYVSKSGVRLNADINGAANILRKCMTDAFAGISDFRYLQRPEVYGFHRLNPQSIPAQG